MNMFMDCHPQNQFHRQMYTRNYQEINFKPGVIPTAPDLGKFCLLKEIINEYFNSGRPHSAQWQLFLPSRILVTAMESSYYYVSSVKQTEAHLCSCQQENLLVKTLVEMSHKLLLFGHYSNWAEIFDLLNVLVELLDGRK